MDIPNQFEKDGAPMILFHCSRMRANITPYACGMNQTAQFACIGCNQEDAL
jgi:hypothetical protein